MLIALIFNEPAKEKIAKILENSENVIISSVNYVEVSIIVESRMSEISKKLFDRFFKQLEIEIHPIDILIAQIAREAYRSFGKGRHKAKLNFGDCFSYALASHLNKPLVYIGNDFTYTDLDLIKLG